MCTQTKTRGVVNNLLPQYSYLSCEHASAEMTFNISNRSGTHETVKTGDLPAKISANSHFP